MYQYKAEVHRIIDADTIVFNLDLGFNVTIKETIRLIGVDAPEQRTDAGKFATKFVRNELLVNARAIYITTAKHKWGKYGRFIADVMYTDDIGDTYNLTHQLIKYDHVKKPKKL